MVYPTIGYIFHSSKASRISYVWKFGCFFARRMGLEITYSAGSAKRECHSSSRKLSSNSRRWNNKIHKIAICFQYSPLRFSKSWWHLSLNPNNWSRYKKILKEHLEVRTSNKKQDKYCKYFVIIILMLAIVKVWIVLLLF